MRQLFALLAVVAVMFLFASPADACHRNKDRPRGPILTFLFGPKYVAPQPATPPTAPLGGVIIQPAGGCPGGRCPVPSR